MTNHEQQFVCNPQVQERWLEHDVVLYHPATDDVTLLDHIGARIWSALGTSTSVTSMATTLAQEFNTNASAIVDDIQELVQTLRDKQLIESLDASAADDDMRA
mgnify:CR=1 FL=1